MDISKETNERKLELCQKYFKAGCAFLPFVWAINAVWFFTEAFRKPPYEQQKEIRKYVIYSALGALIWTAILITWISVFQANRSSWGEFADRMSFIIPLGKP